MSKYSVISILFCLGLLLFGKAKAAEFAFEDKMWSVSTEAQKTTNSVMVRNDFAIVDYSRKALGGNTYLRQDPLFSERTWEAVVNIKNSVDQPSVSALLDISEGWAVNFIPGQNGQTLDLYQLAKAMKTGSSLTQNLPVRIAAPRTTLAATNDLGIEDLIATGESNFSGSSKSRVTNIKVGASKFNGLILKPGEDFSFNKYLGEIDAAHGFLPEMVIKREGVVPEFGGGLCQVSSTAFRAAMQAGLPITERRNHSFAVQYYAPQGTDATIYPGAVDFRFVNDLQSSLLIRTRVEGNKLYFDFYGKKDNRVVELETPRQYDRRTDGSMKAVWIRKVTANGQTNQQEFKSTYVSPNLFKRETTVQTTPNPQAVETPNPSPTN